MRAGVSPEAQEQPGEDRKRESVCEQEVEEEEREESRVKVRLPAWSTLEETDYEKQWEAKRAYRHMLFTENIQYANG